MSEIQTTARATDLPNLVTLLEDQQARKMDVVVRAGKLDAEMGNLIVAGVDPILTEDGVSDPNGIYSPTKHAVSGLATRLGIPAGYLAHCREVNLPTFDANVTGWLTHESRMNSRLLLRCFRGDDGFGIVRALLSDSFLPIDNADILFSVLEGVKLSGVDVQITQCDLTEQNMYVRFECPQVAQMAPTLLAGYDSPFNTPEVRRWRALAQREGMGYEPGTEPIVHAGFVLRNSEVGLGKLRLDPQITVRICKNGLTIPADGMATQHLGVKLEEGVVQPSKTTQAAKLALVRAQATDAVTTFLRPAYLARKVTEMEQISGTPVTDAEETIKVVSTKLKYDEDTRAAILRHFTLGNQNTAAGVMNAVTSVAQTIEDADRQASMEADAIPALEAAARHAR